MSPGVVKAARLRYKLSRKNLNMDNYDALEGHVLHIVALLFAFQAARLFCRKNKIATLVKRFLRL